MTPTIKWSLEPPPDSPLAELRRKTLTIPLETAAAKVRVYRDAASEMLSDEEKVALLVCAGADLEMGDDCKLSASGHVVVVDGAFVCGFIGKDGETKIVTIGAQL